MLKEGAGEPCGVGDTVSIAYVGSLQVDGSVFDQAKTFSFQLGGGVRRL